MKEIVNNNNNIIVQLFILNIIHNYTTCTVYILVLFYNSLVITQKRVAQ